MTRSLSLLLAACLAGTATGVAQEHAAMAARSDAAVPMYNGLGSLHHPITTNVEAAQQYFDQGLRLLWAFNHADATRSFEEAERRDPTCAMCAWGIALASAPNINQPMDSAKGMTAYRAIQRARARMTAASPREQALITAMAARFSPTPQSDRAALDTAYAEAMRHVADTYLDDVESQVLYADALMNLSPWNYWDDGAPRPHTEEILSRLEAAMAAAPEHPGACHLFIHAEEAHDPKRAVPCAERLAALMPGAGHIVHMPGHIYIRVGRYTDAIEANKHAVHADESFLEGPRVTQRGIYPQGYYPHNYHFMSFAASMAGDRKTALYAARKVVEKVGPDVAREVGWLEAITPIVYWTHVNFGQWDALLAEPLPPSDLRFATGQAHYATGVAHAAKGQWAKAKTALDTVTAIAEAFPAGENKTVLQIAVHALAGEMALRRGDAAGAVEHFAAGLGLEQTLPYTEPPFWYYPMRQSLGKALIAAGRAAEAEAAYRQDLKKWPENGWSLYGLAAALEQQGKTEGAKAVRARYERAWKGDLPLTASRF